MKKLDNKLMRELMFHTSQQLHFQLMYQLQYLFRQHIGADLEVRLWKLIESKLKDEI